MTYYRLIDGEWVECQKEDLQHREKYKMITIYGTIVISYWYDPDYEGE